MMIDLLCRVFSFLFFLFLLTSCGDDKNVGRAEVLIPYISGCEDTITKADRFLRKSTIGKSYRLGIDINLFDSVPFSHSELLGVVRIYSIGDWKTLDGGTPIDYLLLQAESIKAACMAENAIELNLDSSVEDVRYLIQRFSRHGNVSIKIDGNRFILYYNDGSYLYEK